MADTFEGFPRWAKVAIAAVGILLGAVCIGFALQNAFNISENLYYGDSDKEILESLYKMSKQNTQVDPYLFVHAFNVQVYQKGIANRHALASLSIACGIALFAIGFSLFLIGADGAFEVQASKGASFAVSASGTAPGLLCFVAATILVGIGATRVHKLSIGDFRAPIANSTSYATNQPETPYTTTPETADALEKQFEENNDDH